VDGDAWAGFGRFLTLEVSAAASSGVSARRGSLCGQVITGDLRSKVLVALACSELCRLFQEIDFI
jgi:hypothetical protein